MKLGDDEADLEALRASRPPRDELRPARAVDPPEHGDRRPGRRRGTRRVDVRVAAPASPATSRTASSASPGPAGGRDEEEARGLVVDGLRRLAAAADDAGVRLGLEPIHASQRDELTLITTIPETLELLDEAGLPDVGIMVDLWHLWDTPEIDRHLARERRPDHRRPRRRLVRGRPRRARPPGRRRRPDRGADARAARRRLERRLGRRDLRRSRTIPRRSGRSTSTRRPAARTPRSPRSSARAAGRPARARSRRTPSIRRRPRARAPPSPPGTTRRAPAAGRRRSA